MKINIIILYISNSYLAWFCEGEKEANCFALFFPKVQSTWQLCLVLYIFINRTCTAICYVFNAISIMVNGLSQYYRALWTQSRAWPQTNKQTKKSIIKIKSFFNGPRWLSTIFMYQDQSCHKRPVATSSCIYSGPF